MSLQDMADIPGTLLGVTCVLKPGGRFVVSIPHPFSEMPFRVWERDVRGRKSYLNVSGYLESGPAVCE
jgi:hypothetical protein